MPILILICLLSAGIIVVLVTKLRCSQKAHENTSDQLLKLHEQLYINEGEIGQAQAANAAKSRFLATVSHEIRTPLNGVLGMAQLLQQTKISAEQKTYIEAIRTSGEALLSLVAQILDFARIEAGKFECVKEPFNLLSLCESVVELLSPTAQGKGIEIALYMERNVPKNVIGDAGRLRQVLTNLCGNAVKFTQKGGVGLRVLCDGDGILLFVIEDTGIGIPKNKLNSIFEEFEQGDVKKEGTGLGLSISRKIVEQLDGTLEVTSKLKKGSKFSLRLYLPASNEMLLESVKVNNTHVLIVGKSPFEVPFMAQKLQENGFKVTVKTTPELALAELSAHKTKQPDILIVDGALEEGSRVLANLASLAGIQTRIILLSPFERTSFFANQTVGSPQEAGFNAWLTKPVRVGSLLERLSGGSKDNENAPQSFKGYNILIAEDNEVNALITERKLTKLGAVVSVARDGLEALKLYEHNAFHLVLLDMRMPRLDGLATLARMKALNSNTYTRFFALTANMLDADRDACLNAGFDAFLTKPLNVEALVKCVVNVKLKSQSA